MDWNLKNPWNKILNQGRQGGVLAISKLLEELEHQFLLVVEAIHRQGEQDGSRRTRQGILGSNPIWFRLHDRLEREELVECTESTGEDHDTYMRDSPRPYLQSRTGRCTPFPTAGSLHCA